MFPFLSIKNAPYIAAALLVLGLLAYIGVQYIQIANRDTVISSQNATIANMQENCTMQETQITLLQDDQGKKKIALAALEKQVKDQEHDINTYRERVGEQQALITGLSSTPAAPLQQKGEVLDNESSIRAVAYINRILHALRVRFSPDGTAGDAHRSPAGVHAVPAAGDAQSR